MSFYITLPSSVKYSAKENTLADYTTELPNAIELEGKWEVGLVELAYKRSWYDVKSTQLIGIMDLKGNRYVTDVIRAGYYTITELIDSINKAISRHSITTTTHVTNISNLALKPGQHVEIYVNDRESRKMIYELKNTIIKDLPKLVWNSHILSFQLGKDTQGNQILPYLEDELSLMLGFAISKDLLANQLAHGPANIWYRPPHTIDALRAYDIDSGIAAIYVYTDIIKPQYIGNVKAPCIRVCSVPTTKYGDNCFLNFPNPSYVPLSHKMFKTVRIVLKDKTNKVIPFEFGETIVKLHFRRNGF